VQAIPNNTSAAIALIEHVWAKPLRAAIRRADGVEIANSWLRVEDLIRIGLSKSTSSRDDPPESDE
jgi:hypothetical protein